MLAFLKLSPLVVLALAASLAGAIPLEESPEIPCDSSTTTQTRKKGNGNPHQNFVFKQISGTTDCTNNPSGSATVTESQTVGYSVSVGFAGDFITGGFDVSESKTTGSTNSYGCKTNNGTHKGSLCVFERIQVTAFTAQTRQCTVNTCTGTTCGTWGGAGTIFAPNKVQGSCYYDNFQLGLSCGVLGSVHKVNHGPAGGPQFIACQPTHAN